VREGSLEALRAAWSLLKVFIIASCTIIAYEGADQRGDGSHLNIYFWLGWLATVHGPF
jgi:hypothetical protein